MDGPGHFNMSDPTALAAFDSASVERGVRYAAERRVTVVDMEPGWAVGEVQGSRADPYLVEVNWRDGPRGLMVSDVCDCPLGGRCKHAVALILTVMRQQALADTDHRPAPIAAVRPGPDWRRALAGIDADPAGQIPLALEFSVNTQRATRHSPEPAVHIVVRPMRMGARGKWIKTGASWVDVTSGYDTGVRDIVPDHLAAVRAMATGNADLRWSRGERAQLLERFGPGLWRSLRMAVDAGVALITDRPGGTVTLADQPAEVQVDLRAADDGGITLGAGLTHEGRPIGSAPGTHHLIGRPADRGGGRERRGHRPGPPGPTGPRHDRPPARRPHPARAPRRCGRARRRLPTPPGPGRHHRLVRRLGDDRGDRVRRRRRHDPPRQRRRRLPPVGGPLPAGPAHHGPLRSCHRSAPAGTGTPNTPWWPASSCRPSSWPAWSTSPGAPRT